MAVLRGNLAPRGAVIKHAAASPALLTHTGRAVVFDSLEDLAARGDDPALDVKADDILVLRNAGPKGAPGMPEAGSFPIPMKLARAGVKDMIRISDARMSGTAFGTIVLHVAPEAAVGGPLALVKTGDRITLDVPKRKLALLVDAKELAARRKAWKAPAPPAGSDRGYAGLFQKEVLQADEGVDFGSSVQRGRKPSRERREPPGHLRRRHVLQLPGLYRRRDPLGGAPDIARLRVRHRRRRLDRRFGRSGAAHARLNSAIRASRRSASTRMSARPAPRAAAWRRRRAPSSASSTPTICGIPISSNATSPRT